VANRFSLLLVGGACDLGHDQQVTGGNRCAPGGNDCWERVVVSSQAEVPTVHPLAVHELVEFIDALWKLIFPKKRLLSLSSLTVGPKLMPPCIDDKSHFEAKLSAVGEMFNSLTVDAALVGDRTDLNGSLAKMRVVLGKKAAEVKLAEDRIERMEQAVDTLRRALDLRASAQHAGAKDRLPRAADAYGLSYPLASYAGAWDRVYARLAEELRVIRDCMREMIQASGA
jgi:hypothetical protein